MQNKILTARNMKFIFLAVFIISTFILLFLGEPFFDEAHAWMVSKSFGFFELLKAEKYEGHLFIWHTILMPFAKNNLFYPYSMYIINWIFCIIALIIFWNKAPFNLVEKTLITFSYPFFWYFSIVARCYSIGILFLFLILSFWRERLKRPYLISTLLILLANTSAMALIGAFVLGLIFLFDLIKEKDNKKIFYSLLILSAGAIVVFCQLFGAKHPDISIMTKEHIFFYKFMIYFSLFDFKNNFSIFYILDKITAFAILLLYFVSVFYFKNKRIIFFLISTVLLMLFIFIFKYPGAWWHYLFFFVYLIASIWLFRIENNDENKFKKPFNFLFYFIALSFCITTLFFPAAFNSEVYNSKTKTISKIIKEKELFKKDDKIYALDLFSQTSTGILPYFNDIQFYNIFGNKKYGFEEYQNYVTPKTQKEKIESLINSLDKNKNNIGISDRKLYPFYEGKDGFIILSPLYVNQNPYFIIYKIYKGLK